MRKLVAWMLVPGVLSLSAIAVARAQDGGAKPNTAARAANAPPLVPVRLNADGNFRIAPPYVADPAFTSEAGCAKGTRHPLHDELRREQDLSDGARRTRRWTGRGRGETAPAVPAEPPQHQTFQRQVAVYIPAGYVPNTPAPFIVVQDERWFVPEDAPAAADGKPRTDLPFMPVMLDNLIHEKRIPPIVAVLLSPGPAGSARSSTTRCPIAIVNFVETEVLPRITRDYQVAFTTDPEGARRSARVPARRRP